MRILIKVLLARLNRAIAPCKWVICLFTTAAAIGIMARCEFLNSTCLWHQPEEWKTDRPPNGIHLPDYGARSEIGTTKAVPVPIT